MDISGTDARRVLELTRELEDAAGPEELWGRALTAVMTLVPAEAGHRYSFSLDPPTASLVAVPYDTFHPDPSAIHEHPEDHPLTEALLYTTEPQAWRVSDAAADREWFRTHCYNFDFRPFGMRRQLIANAAGTSGVAEGYALNRSGGDFTERERDLLGLAQLHWPHWNGNWSNGNGCWPSPPPPWNWPAARAAGSPSSTTPVAPSL